MLLLRLFACTPTGASADEMCAAEFAVAAFEDGVREIGTMVPDAAGAYAIHVEVRWPAAAAEPGDWPVVIVLQGGWDQQGTPVVGSTSRPQVADGVVSIHLDLPGRGYSTGDNDRRGAGSRAAVAAVLRYAAGLTVDQGGCTLGERARYADTSAPYLLGASNGGNLAIATLADAALDLPDVGGLVTWETPAGPQFVNVELGLDPTLYTPGSCALTAAGILCPWPESQLAVGNDVLCFDIDDDGGCTDADINVPGTTDPITELNMITPALRADTEALGLSLDTYADSVTADAWWAERDGARLAGALVANQPELPVLLLGSETDHVLETWSDHPQVFGLGEALQAAGAFWTRLNPGQDWLASNTNENAPGATMSLASPDLRLLSEDQENPIEVTLAAAVLELHDRRGSGDW